MPRPPHEKERTEPVAFTGELSGKPRVVVFWGDRLESYELPERGELAIGRVKECAICVDDRSVSRRHALLHVGGELGLALEDLGSSNGTRVSGKRLTPHRATAVPEGAIIEIGVATLVVRGPTSPTTSMADGAREAPSASPRDAKTARGGTTMDRVRRLCALVGKGTIPVVLLGETGVGKEVMAAAIHAQSARSAKPFVAINCVALPESLLESELFGYERGAFSGATHAKPGLIESAHGGTVLLDEIGELPPGTQVKLLRALEGREVMRLGALRPRVVDVRFIAATNRDLPTLVEEGAFRRDLFHRINGITLRIPPLRERREEIAMLAREFVERASAETGRPPPSIARGAIAWLERQEWKGNVRELRNTMERALTLAEDVQIEILHLQDPMIEGALETSEPSGGLRNELASLERRRIQEALMQARGNQTKAAALLGVSRRTLIGRLDEYQLPRPRRPPKDDEQA